MWFNRSAPIQIQVALRIETQKEMCVQGQGYTSSLLIYLLTPWCGILFEKMIITQLVKKILLFFMEPEGSLPCSEKPATGTYPEPAESSSPHRSLSP
jgi:hypothetical protein